MNLKRRYTLWPNYTFFIVEFFHNYSHNPGNTQTVATHNRIFFLAVLIDKTQIKIFAVFLSQVKDVAHLRSPGLFKNSLSTAVALFSNFNLGHFDVDTKITARTINNVI